MGFFGDKILKLTKQFYPVSRAWTLFASSWFEAFHVGLSKSEERAYEDATAILFSILPDNDNFTVEDATDWERRLGLITNNSVSLANRKLAILRKMNHPGTIKARQHYLYIQGQLQAAGFDVYVYENIFSDGYGSFYSLSVEQVLPNDGYGVHGDIQHGEVQHGDVYSVYSDLFVFPQHGNISHGDIQHNGYTYTNKVVNSIPTDGDLFFDIGSNYRASFFIGGNPLGTFADVDIERRDEFRQLILKLKPTQSVGFLFVNYI